MFTETAVCLTRDSVISPRTGVLRACLSPKRQNLTTLASGEKNIFAPYSLKGLQFRSDKTKRMNYIARF